MRSLGKVFQCENIARQLLWWDQVHAERDAPQPRMQAEGPARHGEDYLGYDMVASKGAGRDVRGNAGGAAQ